MTGRFGAEYSAFIVFGDILDFKIDSFDVFSIYLQFLGIFKELLG
jgi:hypothetical protein